MEQVQLHDKVFEPFIKEDVILGAVKEVAASINKDLAGKTPLFLIILNGSFMFASDLLKEINLDCETSFVKLSSYEGTKSTNNVKHLIGLNEYLKDRHIIIVEDIIDTGNTLHHVLQELELHHPKDIKIATFLYKPKAFTKDFKIDYIGIEIPNDFIVGYGLDYNGFGRNLKEIYKIVE